MSSVPLGRGCRKPDGVDHGEALHFAATPLNCAFVRESGSRAGSIGLRVEGSGVEWSAVAGPREQTWGACRPEMTSGPRTARGQGVEADVSRHAYPTPRRQGAADPPGEVP